MFEFFLKRTVILRWIDLAMLGLVSIFISILVVPYADKFIDYIINTHPNKRFFDTKLVDTLLVVFIFLILNMLGGFRWQHFKVRNLFLFPPVWICGLISTIIYFIISVNDLPGIVAVIKYEWKGFFLNLMPIPFGMLIVLFSSCINQLVCKNVKKQGNDNITDEKKLDLDNAESLFNWINSEEPIKYPHQDLLGHAIIARRIVDLMCTEKVNTFGLMGPYGCGKSSLINLIEYYLSNPAILEDHAKNDPKKNKFVGKFLICKISGWGHSEDTIPQYILSSAVEKINEEVDCLSIIDVPANYRKIIAGASGSLSNIISVMMNVNVEPERQINKLDGILKAINYRMIIFLEDFDRNISKQSLADEVSSLLDRLRRLDNLSFVFIVRPESVKHDVINRICDYQEAII